jgi:hypothetical protein
MKDVAVERCWTGRDVSVLIGCFINSDRLTPGRRVAFRVMSQLADVLEGRSGLLDMANDIVIQVYEIEKFYCFIKRILYCRI